MKCRPNRCLLLAVVFVLATGGSATASSLMEATTKGDSEKVKALLEKGADVNAKENNGLTALMRAAFAGQSEIVQALVAKGADVNTKVNNGFTALMMAKKKGHKEIVRILKEAGAKE